MFLNLWILVPVDDVMSWWGHTRRHCAAATYICKLVKKLSSHSLPVGASLICRNTGIGIAAKIWQPVYLFSTKEAAGGTTQQYPIMQRFAPSLVWHKNYQNRFHLTIYVCQRLWFEYERYDRARVDLVGIPHANNFKWFEMGPTCW